MITSVLKKLSKPAKLLVGFYRYSKSRKFTQVQKEFAQSLSYFKPQMVDGTSDGILLVQMVKDYEYTVKFAAAGKVIAEQNNLSINFYDVDWMKWIGWGTKQQRLYNYFDTTSLEKIVLHFGNNILFSCEDKYHDQNFIANKLKAVKKEVTLPEDILNIKFENILVGDLIYDTYLRYFHQPTIESINKNIYLTIEIALNVFYNFLEFLKRNNVKALLNTYSSYIEHGITARICLDQNIAVYTVGSYNYIIERLKKDFPYHQINHTAFSPERNLSAEQLALAKEKFTSRFAGKIDAATSYMRQSAFTSGNLNPELKKLFASQPRNIVIYAHDFYDSPHVNRSLQFPDLYQYLKQTLQALVDLQGTNVFIKTHPNGIEGCKEKTVELVNGFHKTHFHILDESVSNLNIIELKPDLIASARGTVCAEMAHFEIPTVALFDNIFVNFKFTHSCFDKASYISILRGELKPEIDFDKTKIYSFYYQAYLEKTIHTENNVFSTLASFKGNTFNDEYLQFLLSSNYPKQQQALVGYYTDAIAKMI